jgi:glycosyltransferase involved in cell wall biosynthesis
VTESDGKAPLVSIIVPMLNEEAYIGACLDSLQSSDLPAEAIEVLLGDLPPEN